jgi:hypothetical protein
MLKSKRLEKRVSMPKVVNFFDLIHLNERLEQQGLLSKIHLRDTCGKQTLWIELPSDEKTDEREKIDGQELEKTKEQIVAFFSIKGMTVEFDLTGGKNFWIV